VRFFEQVLWSPAAQQALAERLGLSRAEAEALLRRHLGVCLDLCHAAVEYEDPQEALDRLAGAGITIAKIQVSSGLRLDPRDEDARRALREFDDAVYLHQVVARRGERLTRHADLPDAQAAWEAGERADEWRVHFHVPVFCARAGRFDTTQDFVRAVLRRHARQPLTEQLEVETYTWNVLPAALRGTPLPDAIARELRWVHDELELAACG
jgi:hypothetical protein